MQRSAPESTISFRRNRSGALALLDGAASASNASGRGESWQPCRPASAPFRTRLSVIMNITLGGLVGPINLTEGRHMKKSQIFAVCLSLLVGYVAATSLNHTSAGQPPAPQPAGQEGQVGRYQLMSAGEGFYPSIILTDTMTGRVWIRDSNPNIPEHWRALGSPASPPVDRPR